MKEKIKCIICRKPVTNELLKKDGFYFCDNTCEGEYWHKYESKKISTEKMMMFQINTNIPIPRRYPPIVDTVFQKSHPIEES